MKIYLASPYGFAASTQGFLASMVAALEAIPGVTVFNPWDLSVKQQQRVLAMQKMELLDSRQECYTQVMEELGKQNAVGIMRADLVVAVLDGVDVDSGVASEIGLGYGLDKPIIGYRGDFRCCGDDIGGVVNLQVEYFIQYSGGGGGKIFRELPEVFDEVRRLSSLVAPGGVRKSG